MTARLLLFLLLCGGRAMAQGEQLHDYAYGIPLQLDGDGALYSLALPEAVYRSAQDPALGDLRVFNGRGEVVPHLLQSTPAQRLQAPRRIVGRLYRLPTQENLPPGERGPVQITIDRDGALVDFYGGPLPLQGAGAGEYYLLDAREAGGEVASLHLQWEQTNEPLLTQVTVYGSDDLNHWNPVTEKQTVAALRHGEMPLIKDSVPLPMGGMKYYRIHWPPGSKGVALRQVELTLRPRLAPAEGPRLVVHPLADKGDGGYVYDLDGRFPVDRIRLLMPQRNTLVEASLLSRGDIESAWEHRYRGVFYDLDRQGQRLQSEPVRMTPLTHRWWRLEVEQSGGGLGSGLPQLELEWHPHTLFFVARGEMPYTLAFGRYGQLAGQQHAGDTLLRRIADDEIRAGMVKVAVAGEPYELGGKSRLLPPSAPIPWRRWLLWLVLLGGVLLLALMARSLYRQIHVEGRS